MRRIIGCLTNAGLRITPDVVLYPYRKGTKSDFADRVLARPDPQSHFVPLTLHAPYLGFTCVIQAGGIVEQTVNAFACAGSWEFASLVWLPCRAWVSQESGCRCLTIRMTAMTIPCLSWWWLRPLAR